MVPFPPSHPHTQASHLMLLCGAGGGRGRGAVVRCCGGFEDRQSDRLTPLFYLKPSHLPWRWWAGPGPSEGPG
ncbi:hypothetical protein O3P69_014260 [Scylla paramamosain]|uniref:Uncharacterized protein n=1 Tax=Scylla paramamosain TaxID=85552 RepID=A0AAW0TA81_SCYPA